MIDRAMYFSKNECWIMLQKAGMDRIIAFEDLGDDEITDAEIADAFISLTSRGLIEGEGDTFKISDRLVPYINALRQAVCVVIERRNMDRYPVSCIYLGNADALRVEMDCSSGAKVALRLCGTDSFIDEETGYEFMPDKASDLPADYEDYTADVKTWEDSFRDDSSLLIYYRVYDVKNCELIKRIFVKRESLCELIITENPNGDQLVFGYSNQKMSEVLRATIGGEIQ